MLLECEDCGWRGKPEDCYYSITREEEETKLCPKCSSDRLIEIEEEPAQLELVPA